MAKGWNGTHMRATHLRQQGRGAKGYLRCQVRTGWLCSGCGKEHSAKTGRVVVAGQNYCWRQFYKLPASALAEAMQRPN